MFFARKKEGGDIQQLNAMLDMSFKNVRQDIYNIFSWLDYLNERILSVQKQVDSSSTSKEEVKKIVNESYETVSKKLTEIDTDFKKRLGEFDTDINKKIEKFDESLSSFDDSMSDFLEKQKSIPYEIDELKARLKKISHPEPAVVTAQVEQNSSITKLEEINQRLIGIEEQRKKSLRENMMRRITRNSKEYVKNVIISLIRKYGKIPALKLKEMIVDEQGLCSKSSFYRLLNEVQEESEISVAHKGKEKEIVFRMERLP